MKSNTPMTDAAKLEQELEALKFAISPHVSLQKLAQRAFDAEFERDIAKVNEREMTEAFHKEMAENATLRAALVELVAAVTSKGAEDTRDPIAWSGSPAQNRRMFAAIAAARGIIG